MKHHVSKKLRVPIPAEVSAEALFLADRTCCVCNIPGKPVQLHHIDEIPSNNKPDNLAVLCLDCHNDTMIKGGFGRKLDEAQVRIYNDEWLQRVQQRKNEADKLASLKTVTGVATQEDYIEYKGVESHQLLVKYLKNIIAIHRAQLIVAKTKWNDGTTYAMKQGCYAMIDFYQEVLQELASFYPRNHFGPSPSKYFSELISSKYTWYRLIEEPYGQGTGGTIVGISVAGSVEYDVRNMVSNIACTLLYKFELESSLPLWKVQWDAAGQKDHCSS